MSGISTDPPSPLSGSPLGVMQKGTINNALASK